MTYLMSLTASPVREPPYPSLTCPRSWVAFLRVSTGMEATSWVARERYLDPPTDLAGSTISAKYLV